MAASAETLSEHHIGRAIVEKARSRGLELLKPTEFQAVAGEGIIARFEHRMTMPKPCTSATSGCLPTPKWRFPRQSV